jgi:endo-1,4-beta-D-glucanase Y
MRPSLALVATVLGLALTGAACDAPDDEALADTDELGAAACVAAAGPAIPFGSHLQPYASGTIKPSNKTQAQLDAATKSYYDKWKSKYLKKGCGTGRVYVASGMSGKKTVSEAHGYGMVILAYMAGYDSEARTLFDGMYKFFVDHPTASSPDLLAWAQDNNCKNTDGDDSATDGDLDVAYALLLADKQWGSGGAINYKKEAKRVIKAIGKQDVNSTHDWTLLGNWSTSGDPTFYKSTRTSDFMPGHFAAFADATGDGNWDNLVDSTYDIVSYLQSHNAPNTGLLPDFVVNPGTTPKPAPPDFLEGDTDGKYGYNACRDPWRLAVHYLTTGDTRSKASVTKLNSWIKSKTGSTPSKIRAGYGLNGTPTSGSDYETQAFIAPFGVAAMVDSSNQSWLNALWDNITSAGAEGYYEDTIKMQVMIVMSRNWWTPGASANGFTCSQ